MFGLSGVKQWQDASKTTSCIQRVIAFRQKTVINFCLNPFICLPTRKSPSRISWANNWLIPSKLAKPLKNVLALKMVTLCNPWSRQMCLSVGATAFCTVRTWLSYASTDTVNADHSQLGALSAACHGITRVSAEFFWLPGLVKVHWEAQRPFHGVSKVSVGFLGTKRTVLRPWTGNDFNPHFGF